MPIRIFLTNLAKYNEGKLVGQWIDLPIEEDELEKNIRAVLGENDEECFITDYEAPFNIEEFENVSELNRFAEEYESLDEDAQKKVLFLVNVQGCSRDEAVEKHEDVTFYAGMSLKEVAESLVDDGVFGKIPDSIINYIDYEAIARDLSFDGYYETEEGVFWHQ